jgi:hypothetical protein
MIPNGNTLVMGGLVQDNPTASIHQSAALGGHSRTGMGFPQRKQNHDQGQFDHFYDTHDHQNTDFQQASSASADFLQSKPAVMKSRMNPNSIWDGAEPRGDWSNPAPVAG